MQDIEKATRERAYELWLAAAVNTAMRKITG